MGYFGPVLGRPCPGGGGLGWHEGDDDELGGGMDATAAGSRGQVTDSGRRVQAHGGARIGGGVPPQACGTVPWRPGGRRHPARHALLVPAIGRPPGTPGTPGIFRQAIGGAAGLGEGVRAMPAGAGAAWRRHCGKPGPDRPAGALGPGAGHQAVGGGEGDDGCAQVSGEGGPAPGVWPGAVGSVPPGPRDRHARSRCPG
jgi:hypothetical protein